LPSIEIDDNESARPFLLGHPISDPSGTPSRCGPSKNSSAGGGGRNSVRQREVKIGKETERESNDDD